MEEPDRAAPIALRLAEAADCRLLFEWVNRPDSLAGKLMTGGPIAWASHKTWFEKRIGSGAATRIWIVEAAGEAVGQVRLEALDGDAPGAPAEAAIPCFDVDIYLTPAARGRGAARRALTLAGEAMARERGCAVLRALIRCDNAASIALFEGAGFARIEARADTYVYERKLRV